MDTIASTTLIGATARPSVRSAHGQRARSIPSRRSSLLTALRACGLGVFAPINIISAGECEMPLGRALQVTR